MYAILRLQCRDTSPIFPSLPSEGLISLQSRVIRVLFPQPFLPQIATREFKLNLTLTLLTRYSLSADHRNEILFDSKTHLEPDFTPSMEPGIGKLSLGGPDTASTLGAPSSSPPSF